jgi:transcriptional regulator with XRE-family HTH domain
MKPTNNLPSALKSAREAAGLTQAELGKITKINPAQISHYETGVNTPSITKLQLIAGALGISLDDLVS